MNIQSVTKISIKKVVKLDGSKEPFDPNKISNSIWKAVLKVGGSDKKRALELGDMVLKYLNKKYPRRSELDTEIIGHSVEDVLVKNGHTRTAKEFILYRDNKKHIRQEKKSLGISDDIGGLTYSSLFILKKRYLKKDKEGKVIETPRQMIRRVAKALANVEETPAKKKKWEKKFFEIMISLDFLPGTRTLANAGKERQQMANCFVFDVEDSIEGIFKTLYESSVIKKHGGGCGYNFGKIRPKDDLVHGEAGLASGPVKLMEMFDTTTRIFRQEGRYESGNMSMLNDNHPDIFNFITAKEKDGFLSKTNISIAASNKFMKAVKENRDWDLINPRTGEVVNTVKAGVIFDLTSQLAWQTGDPGMIYIDHVNQNKALANPLARERGPITATNPCGEEPLYPYESCNLGYFNFTKFVKNGSFDFKRFKEVVKVATRLMDNVATASWFPLEKVIEAVKNHRRIGMGAVGWAETLARLNIPYDSKYGFKLAEKVTKAMYEAAFESSVALGHEKGPFPYVKYSIWKNKKDKPRNVALLTFPPSSGNAVICGTSFGIEPYFALAYYHNILGGVRMPRVDEFLLSELTKAGIYSKKLIEKIIDNHGSIQQILEIPARIRKVFKTAHDINWREHVKMQAAFQKWTDNAITKTINMPASSTPEDIGKAYMLAWELGCKGITIYRDQTKAEQVIEFGNNKS